MDAADRLLQQALEVTRAECAILLVLDEPPHPGVARARDQLGRDLGKDVEHSRSVVMRVYREGRGVCLIDTANDGEIRLDMPVLERRLLTVLCVPLRHGTVDLGIVYVHSLAAGMEFTDTDLARLEEVAHASAPDLHRWLRRGADR